jgi:hypothetical protein
MVLHHDINSLQMSNIKTVVPRQIGVYGSDLYDGITVLKRAGIDKRRIRECVACMEAGDGFDECARRVGVVIRREGR